MKFKTKEVGFFRDQITIAVPRGYLQQTEKLKAALDKGKELSLELKAVNKPRSLNANAALWAMLGDMAAVLHTTADEVYIEALRKYGVSKFMAVLPEDVEIISRQYRWAVERRRYKLNGVDVIALQVWIGSSEYDTAQFSRLLDGVISDAKDLGVDFISKADRDLYVSTWGERDGPSI